MARPPGAAAGTEPDDHGAALERHGHVLERHVQRTGAEERQHSVQGQGGLTQRPRPLPFPNDNDLSRLRSRGRGAEQVLWRATNEAGYCEARAEEFLEKLESWGWQCDTGNSEDSEDSEDSEGSEE